MLRTIASHNAFDDDRSNTVCGLLSPSFVHRHIVCNGTILPARFQPFANTALQQVRYGVFAQQNSPSLASDLCGQRVNDSQWQCYPTDVMSPLQTVNMSVIVPLATRKPLFVQITAHAQWSSRQFGRTIVYPNVITFTQSNGTVGAFPANSIIFFSGYSADLENMDNAVWASSNLGYSSVLITNTIGMQSRNVSVIDVILTALCYVVICLY